jgi:hypothetical protein
VTPDSALRENENRSIETTQTIGNARFVVVSRFKESGSTVDEKISNLLKREAQERRDADTMDTPGQIAYTG